MKDFLKKHKKKLVVLVTAVVLYAVGTFLGVDIPLDQVFQGDLSEIGEAIESAE